MYEDILLSPIETTRRQEELNTGTSEFFINFLNRLEGWKTKCKNLHWAAPKKNIHVYLDEFLEILSEYQDSLAEEYQGLLGHMQPNVIKGVVSEALNAIDFINEVKGYTYKFYDALSKETAILPTVIIFRRMYFSISRRQCCVMFAAEPILLQI